MKTLLGVAAVGAAMMGFAGGANAAPMLTINAVSTIHGSSYSAEVNAPGVGGGWNDVRLSPQTITGTLDGVAVTLKAFCIDLAQTSGSGIFGVKTLAEYLGTDTGRKYDAITALVNGYGASSNSALVDAAVQLAIWEAFYETSNSFDVAKNGFKSQDWSDENRYGSAVKNAANTYLKGLGDITINPNLQLFVATNSKKQDLLYFVEMPPAVPEPATWAMMIMGLGMVGASMRRRAGRTTVSFA